MSDRPEQITFEGLAGAVACALDWPRESPRGWALILHPHPLHGGTRDNKVVTTLARSCVEHGLLAVRPDFRGVGESAGEFDRAVGETQDMSALVEQFGRRYPEYAAGTWVLGGFSFGTSVAAQLYAAQAGQNAALPAALILVGSAVDRFAPGDIDVPSDTFLVHGEADEVVPLSEAMDYARAHGLPITVIPEASHFFHGKLIVLRQLLQQRLAAL